MVPMLTSARWPLFSSNSNNRDTTHEAALKFDPQHHHLMGRLLMASFRAEDLVIRAKDRVDWVPADVAITLAQTAAFKARLLLLLLMEPPEEARRITATLTKWKTLQSLSHAIARSVHSASTRTMMNRRPKIRRYLTVASVGECHQNPLSNRPLHNKRNNHNSNKNNSSLRARTVGLVLECAERVTDKRQAPHHQPHLRAASQRANQALLPLLT